MATEGTSESGALKASGQVMEAVAKKSDLKLRKRLGIIDLLFLSLGGIIGSGWLFGSFKASRIAGPASILSWLIGGIIIIFIALNYAELGSMIPRTGAIVRYGEYSHGNLAGFFFGWIYFLSAVSVPAIEAEAVVTYAASYYPSLTTGIGTFGYPVMTGTGTLFAVILMVGFFFLNFFGIKVMGKTNTGMTWWKLIIPFLTVFVLFGVGFNINNLSGLSYTNSAGTTVSGFMPYGFGPVMAAVATAGIVFSYLGFRQGLDYGGEARNPQRAIPIATVGAVVIGMVLYILLQTVYVGGIKWGYLGVSPGNWLALGSTALSNGPMAELAQASGLVWLTYILFGDAYVSPTGTLNVYLGTSMRTLYGIGSTGFLPKSFIRISERTRIPLFALITSLIVGLIFFLPFPSWYSLVGFITSATVFTYLVGGPALATLRKHAPELKRPFKLPGYKVIAPIGFIGAALVVYWSGWPLDLFLWIAAMAGFVLWGLLYATKGINQGFDAKALKAGIWGPVFITVLTFLTWIGSSTFYSGAVFGNIGGQPLNLIKFPYDVIVVIIVALIFYFWAAASGIKTEAIETIIKENSQYLTTEEKGAGGR